MLQSFLMKLLRGAKSVDGNRFLLGRIELNVGFTLGDRLEAYVVGRFLARCVTIS